MTLDSPACPTCQTALTKTAQGRWVCPQGHGVGLTLSKTYGAVQDDEIKQLWALARRGVAGTRACPILGEPMVAVHLGYDTDEVFEGTQGDGPDAGQLDLDVCVECELIWFDPGEMEALPADLPNPEPTPEQQAAMDRIVSTFGDQYLAAEHERDSHQLTERLYQRLAGHGGFVGFVDRHSFWA